MLTKRIIPCLDVKDNRVVKGVNFLNLRDAGDPVELGKRYSDSGADELEWVAADDEPVLYAGPDGRHADPG